MVKFFSWVFVFLIITMILMSFLPFIKTSNLDLYFLINYIALGISAIGLIISLIFDRLKTKKEEEKNDYRKY